MRRILYILCCFYIHASLHAQPLADSLIKSLTNTPVEKRILIYLDVASKIQNKDYQNCVRICNELISIGEKNKNKHALGEAYLLKGLTNYFAGEYDETLKYYLKSIEAFESINDHAGNAKVHNELGFFYRKQKQDSLSSASFTEAYRLACLSANKGIMGTALNNQGISAQDKGNHQLAISLFTKAQQLYQEIKDSIGVSYTLDYISVSLAANQNYTQAIALQKQSLELRLKHKDSNAVALSYFNLAEFEKLHKDLTRAESYLLSCLEITEKINYKELTASCYKILADINFKERNPYKAYVYHVKYSVLNEELFNEGKSKQINSLQTKYETAKRIQQIEFLQHENELKEINNRNQRIVWISVLFIIIGISLGSYQYLKRKKQQEFDQAIIKEKDLRNKAMIEAEERERIRIARDLHDGIAQTMTAAKMQLEY
nr:tetratricopeptide repeat protein [Chitinophagaceae bacterium]